MYVFFLKFACPNITGNSNYGLMFSYATNDLESYSEGAITVNRIDFGGNLYNGAQTTRFNLYFDASHSNSIYGNSNTVQPPSLAFNYIVKY